MITREQAKRLRSLIERMSADLTDEDAYTAPQLFPLWKLTTYAIGDRVQYQDKLYKCLQAHEAQETWTPDSTPSLWVRVDDPHEEFPEWRQPTGSTDAYSKGDKVTYNSKHYISDVDANVWPPDVYGWTEVA